MHFVVLLSALVACAAGVPLTSTKPTPQGRILDGNLAFITDFPFQVSLRYKENHMCGAVIIDEYRALTAAHCLDEVDGNEVTASDLSVAAGSARLDAVGSQHNVTYFLRHEDYKIEGVRPKGSLVDYDIALLWVDPHFQFTDRVNRTLLTDKEPKTGNSVVVSGWGRNSGLSVRNSNELRWSFGTIIEPEKCEDKIGFTRRMLCFAGGDAYKGPCEGDSGGPIVDEGTRKLVGIVSAGNACDYTLKIDAPTNIYRVGAWIIKHTLPTSQNSCLLL